MYVCMFVCTYVCVYTQRGIQPIHYAAGGGHINVIKALVEKYGVNPQGNNVCMYLANICMQIHNYIYVYVRMYVCTLVWKIFVDTYIYKC